MRVIKFRGKDLNTGEWAFGDLHTLCDKPHIHTEKTSFPFAGKRSFVDENTIGQFTGIKDDTGKEIYEGDIVLIENVFGYGTCKGVIKWDDNGYWYTDYKGDYDNRIMGAKGFVIGNIHDNPELLKGGRAMKRRIVKETCLCGVSRPDIFTMPRDRFVVEILNGLGKWETELIPIADGFQENVPAVFLTEEDALMYVNGEYGKIGREVIWEGEQ